MTTQAVRRFAQCLAKDSTLRGKLQAVRANDKDAALAQVVRIAAEAGFTLRADELEKRFEELVSGELAPDDLDHVAGGARGSYQHNQSDFEFVKALAKVVPDL
jgi:predicted ribosomally synthesized peptide with nif11-like leader